MDKQSFTRNAFGNIQSYIAMGYLFLLIVGSVSYSIMYSFIDVNIFNYSNVLDLLISPIVVFINSPRLLLILMVLLVLYLWWASFSEKRILKANNASSIEKLSGEAKGKVRKIQNNRWLIPTVFVLSLYIGFSVGRGGTLKEMMQSGDFRLNHQIVFVDDSQKNVRLIGANSQYLFYLKKGDNSVTITPIAGNIKSLKKLRRDKSK